MSFSKTFLRRINSPTVNIYIGKKWEKDIVGYVMKKLT